MPALNPGQDKTITKKGNNNITIKHMDIVDIESRNNDITNDTNNIRKRSEKYNSRPSMKEYEKSEGTTSFLKAETVL